MTGITSSQNALAERAVIASADPSIGVVVFFEGISHGYLVRSAVRTEGVLEFITTDGHTARFREDMIIGIVEREL